MRRKTQRSAKIQASPELSLDKSVKDLLKQYPLDTWRFLLPDLAAKLGDPISWSVEDHETRRYNLHAKGFVMDLPIVYKFAGGTELVVVVLIEHWATARSMDMYRTLSYFADLCGRYPGKLVIPVALVTELKPGKVPERLHMDDPLREEPILHFSHRIQVVAREEVERWIHESNIVATMMALAMRSDLTEVEKARMAALRLETLVDSEEARRLFPMIFRVGDALSKRSAPKGRLTEQEQEEIMAAKTTIPEPRFYNTLRAEGKAEGKAEGMAEGDAKRNFANAAKMAEHGIPWETITDVTGLHPADLESANRS